MDKYFGISAAGSTIRREIAAGVTTFLTLAYIIFVNPSVLVQAVPGIFDQSGNIVNQAAYNSYYGAFMVATIMGSVIATLVMGLYANYPFALAPGMGLNAYFTYTVCMKLGISWQLALAAVFIEGIIFIVLTVTGARTFVARAVPQPVKAATGAGIGLFIAFIGLKNAGIVLPDPVTAVTLGQLNRPDTLLAIIGFFITAILFALNIPGSILIGIILTTVIGAVPAFGVTHYQGIIGKIPDISPTFLKFQFDAQTLLTGTFWIVVGTFFFVDFFDTLGTLTGLAEGTGFTKKNGEIERATKAYLADAVGTVVGAIFGTSTVTTYVESSTGIAVGGRTGLTAVVVAILMLAMLFFSPLALTIPSAATAPALIFVGVLMIKSLLSIKWDDITDAVPAFVTLVMIPFTYSIANGIALGIITYPIIKALSGKWKEVHWFTWLLAILFIGYLSF
ncbi:MAG TPA: NCS2 family permease, partial [Fervidobacterium sp.]|nr:NCS2 family permease [Fervidobacterium sp.]HOL04112.1 NCS2 family permease [Fervidobacterium sp.]HQG01808.1 NCS2 family permease [Fervidobacterium sp.]HQI93841.1 NCS2 family permease [Fervidobacterium sp.]HRB91740.1 NCS2 family permease [Fervidobacterium sp.]